MDLAGYVINAVLVEGRSVTDVCEAHDISRSWLYELIGRYRELGDEGLRRLSKRLGSSPTRVSPPVEEQIVACIRSSPTWASTPGAHTIQRHLLRRRRGRAKSAVPSVATIWRVLSWRMRDTFRPGSLASSCVARPVRSPERAGPHSSVRGSHDRSADRGLAGRVGGHCRLDVMS